MLLISDQKDNYKNDDIILLQQPEKFHIPLFGYNSNFDPIVKQNEYVSKYQILALSQHSYTGIIHSPVSGVIGSVIQIDNLPYLELFNDFREHELPLKKNDLKNLTLDLFVEKLFEYGIEGSGGARYPTYSKYRIGKKQIKTLIINGAECEPYLAADYAIMKQYSHQLGQAVALIQRVVDIENVVLGLELKNKSIKPLIEKSFKSNGVKGCICLLPNTYPQGGELQLIKSVTGKVLSKGSIPSDHGIIVNNVGTLWAIYLGFFEGKPYTERVVTFYDENEQKGFNYWVKIGTPVNHISPIYFSSQCASGSTFILGGPMMGVQSKDTRQGIHKGVGGLLLLKDRKSKINNCILCGYCADVCPQNLLPLEFARYICDNSVVKLLSNNLMDCIECGACAYACPADVPLMYSIKEGKKLIFNERNVSTVYKA
ncbi:RnfABCDGE type electron transport complex subunit C [Chryseobacterium sp. OSA05B]|uniref:RnfABCDGE type electron transport complex subunit C n=1 Tax=Chryseobacterium sp. OSA05B TaxID=2862650 RepID=UPI001CC036DE|nr:RnfABCDGE type electron transport complex subunit C [Chryseobacterium sp. OSA05B]